MRRSAVFLFLAACSNDGAVLGTLDGPWQGELDADGTLIALVAEFEWVEKDELLFGRVQLTLPNEPQTTWAVRRWEALGGDTVYLDLTDTADITRGLDLDGTTGKGFAGDATITFDCPTGTCGYVGPFTLTGGGPGVPLTTTTLPTGDSGGTGDTGT
jgi:hypothetical protein